ncbi:BamA/TamA family outer membrane protein [filamentous cyanobacterium LEGE 11480]|uniref:BamA/TamA family outer membrane protein n=1 Tax=Romeriopsis navalis LEGE 11480 TaxID=2777977 RepID=A0A928Z4P8_9CYAN|nr:BamA/TamA family outer membrane protein [Romeriopsis navalis]MBE9032851.1 BamA/TamA family outer membrane protein [Romeriopsis navalis LEGE 11480]
MRLPLAAACSLGALTVCHSAPPAQAATAKTAPTADQNWVIQTESPTLANTVTTTPPEMLTQPESMALPESTPQALAARLPASPASITETPATPITSPTNYGAAALTTTPRRLTATPSPTTTPSSTTAKQATPPPPSAAITISEPTAQIVAQQSTPKPSEKLVRPKSAIAPPSQPVDPPADAVKPSRLNLPNFVIETNPVSQTPTTPVTSPSENIAPPIANDNTNNIAPAIKPTTPTPTGQNSSLAADLAVQVLDVKITGVDPEIQKILRDRLATRPGRQSSLNQINQDIATMLSTELIGSASFTTAISDNGISVTFQATPVTVQNIQLRNAKVLTTAVASEIFKDQLGQAIQPSKLDQGVRAINQWYLDNGYSLSRAIDVEPNRNGSLKLTVKEGTIDELKIRFVDEFGRTVDDDGKAIQGKTKESFIRREIKSKQGDIFQVSRIQADLKNLYQTGLFINAGVTLEGDADKTSVVYNIAEGANRQANIGGGFSSDTGIFGSATYNDQNLGGTGNQIGGRILLGSKDLQFNGKFTRPFRDSDPSRWGYSINAFRERGISRVFDDDILLANGDQVREGKIGAGIGLTKSLGNNWNGTIDLGYTRTSQRDGSGNVVQFDNAGNPLSLSGRGIDDQVTLGFTAGFDQVDNPSNPKSGSRLQLSTEQGLPIGTGSSAANKLSANFTQYVPVNIFNKNQQNRDTQEVFAFNVQGGTTIGALAPYKAFTLGGVDSVRGYGQGELGIGRSYIQASAEYRFPLISSLGGTVFADFASDLGSASLVPGAPGQDRNRPGSGFGVGAGIRYNSPLGILRADWGFTDSGTNRVQFTIGEKF